MLTFRLQPAGLQFSRAAQISVPMEFLVGTAPQSGRARAFSGEWAQ
jgi:hypothetical protein